MKNQYYQRWRGICILCIVLIHLPLGTEEDGSHWLWIGIRPWINFATATFVYMAGYFCRYKEGDNIGAFVGKRLKRLGVPYLLFAILYLAILPLVRERSIDPEWAWKLMTGYGPMYFLLVVIQCALLTPWMVKTSQKRWGKALWWSITPIYLIGYYGYCIRYGKEMPAALSPFAPWCIYYYMGLTCREEAVRERVKQLVRGRWIALVLGAALILGEIEGFGMMQLTGSLAFAISQIKVTSMLCTLCVLLMIIKKEPDVAERRSLLSRIGDYSMEIFLLHPLFNWVYKYIFIILLPIGDYHTLAGLAPTHLLVWICSIGTCIGTAKLWERIKEKGIIIFEKRNIRET